MYRAGPPKCYQKGHLWVHCEGTRDTCRSKGRKAVLEVGPEVDENKAKFGTLKQHRLLIDSSRAAPGSISDQHRLFIDSSRAGPANILDQHRLLIDSARAAPGSIWHIHRLIDSPVLFSIDSIFGRGARRERNRLKNSSTHRLAGFGPKTGP